MRGPYIEVLPKVFKLNLIANTSIPDGVDTCHIDMSAGTNYNIYLPNKIKKGQVISIFTSSSNLPSYADIRTSGGGFLDRIWSGSVSYIALTDNPTSSAFLLRLQYETYTNGDVTNHSFSYSTTPGNFAIKYYKIGNLTTVSMYVNSATMNAGTPRNFRCDGTVTGLNSFFPGGSGFGYPNVGLQTRVSVNGTYVNTLVRVQSTRIFAFYKDLQENLFIDTDVVIIKGNSTDHMIIGPWIS